jgi:hypothetical protein
MKTLSKVLHLSVLLLVPQARSAWGVEIPNDAPTRVADVGDPARVAVEGVQIFTEGDIRRAPQTDWDYLVASHLEATLAECLATLEDRVRAGYRGCGFRAVAIQARFDLSAGRIVAKVTQGPRSRCGGLEVTGLKSIPVAHFTRRFAEELTPARDQTTPPAGLWRSGMSRSFTPGSLASYSAAARDCASRIHGVQYTDGSLCIHG